MRLGFSSYAYRWAVGTSDFQPSHPLDGLGLLDKASKLGVEVVQLCDNWPLHHLSSPELDHLKKASRQKGVALEVGTEGLEHLARYVDLAAELGSRALRLVLGTDDVALAESALRSALPRCRDRGIVLAVENHFDLASPALVDLLQRVGDPALGVCLDTANSVGLLERPVETIATLAPFALQVHLKDFLVERAPIGYHVTGRPLGEGWLDVAVLMDALGDAGQRLDFFIESWMDPEDGVEATLTKEEQWMAQSVRIASEQLGQYSPSFSGLRESTSG